MSLCVCGGGGCSGVGGGVGRGLGGAGPHYQLNPQ